MEASNLHQEMLQYFVQLTDREKKSVLDLIKTFLVGRRNSHSRISLEQYNNEIDTSMPRIDAGDFVSQETLEQDADEW